MLKLGVMQWDDAFSYASNNKIDFTENPLTQIVGSNGHGKSSIPSILEEILFNKNSKGIKKASIINRYTGKKFYTASLCFSKDNDEYEVHVKRGSTQTVRLMKNGEDISAHTPTNTYKLLESIIGYDHKTFSQIVYQSSTKSLEFLTATDTKRKEFLIELLGLEKYSRMADVFKDLVKSTNEELTGVKSSLNTVQGWLRKFGNEPLDLREEQEIPPAPTSLIEEAHQISVQLSTLEHDNKLIIQNNKYKEILDSIDIVSLSIAEEVSYPTQITQELTELTVRLRVEEKAALAYSKEASNSICPTCKGPIDTRDAKAHMSKHKEEVASLQAAINTQKSLSDVALQKYQTYQKVKASIAEWEKYHSLFNPTLPVEIHDAESLKSRYTKLQAEIKHIQTAIAKSTKFNQEVAAHNSKVEVILLQKEEMLIEEDTLKAQLQYIEGMLNIRQLLVKTFSTTGLVAYKIECLVKDLESAANEYLVDLSDGRFQLGFIVSSSDKLNVVITDNGVDIEINALSGGELARVNTATLLGIRKIMQAISNSRTNLLILDETIDNLDAEGKEKLVEILLNEEYLNTFIISHGFTHPLLQKLTVIKENDISRIEHG